MDIISISISIISISVSLYLFIKMRKLLSGNAKDLPESILDIKTQINDIREFTAYLSKREKEFEKRIGRTMQATELIRFNPYQGVGGGGNQSFSASFVNESGNGIVVTGLYYSGDRMNVFVKPITNFSSPLELMDEEKEVIEKSRVKITSS